MTKDELDELETTLRPMSITSSRKLFRGFLYGPPGAGKTTLAAKCVENKGLAVTSDSAWVVIEKYPEIAKKWDRIPFDGFSQVRAICDAHNEGHPQFSQYDTLLWDPTSAAIDVMLRRTAETDPYDPKQNPAEGIEGWPQYRKVERFLIDTIASLNSTQMNIIYTAHVRDPKESDLKKIRPVTYIRPTMPEACYLAISREVQMLGYMYKERKGAKRKIQLEGTSTEEAKCQIPTIPEDTYDVDLIPGLINKWKGLL